MGENTTENVGKKRRKKFLGKIVPIVLAAHGMCVCIYVNAELFPFKKENRKEKLFPDALTHAHTQYNDPRKKYLK